MAKKIKKPLRKNKLLISTVIVVGILLIASGWFYIRSQTTYPLGDKMEYIGKRDYGCAWFCDSPPSATYSYATDMTPPELLEYFPEVHVLDKTIDIDQWQDRGSSFRIHFFNEARDRFTLSFRTDTDKHIRNFNLQPTTKSYIIEIESDEYNIAKDSL